MTTPAASFIAPVSAGEVLATSLEAFISVAALNLGDSTAEGQRLEQPEPREAWFALMAASALLIELRPMLDEAIAEYYRVAVLGLLQRFAREHAELQVPAPAGQGSLAATLEAASRKLEV